MFWDLVGSTALSARLDPEDLRSHVRAYQTASADVIARFDALATALRGSALAALGDLETGLADMAPRRAP